MMRNDYRTVKFQRNVCELLLTDGPGGGEGGGQKNLVMFDLPHFSWPIIRINLLRMSQFHN